MLPFMQVSSHVLCSPFEWREMPTQCLEPSIFMKCVSLMVSIIHTLRLWTMGLCRFWGSKLDLLKQVSSPLCCQLLVFHLSGYCTNEGAIFLATLHSPLVFAILFLVTSLSFCAYRRLRFSARRITTSADSDVLHWLCHGKLSFCSPLVNCMSVSPRKWFYGMLSTTASVDSHVYQLIPWALSSAKLFTLWIGRSSFVDDCRW
jgi:hypothetical protein